jgi:hypothetical protein
MLPRTGTRTRTRTRTGIGIGIGIGSTYQGGARRTSGLGGRGLPCYRIVGFRFLKSPAGT